MSKHKPKTDKGQVRNCWYGDGRRTKVKKEKKNE